MDTTGAGDAFNAGYLAARMADRSTDDALRLANHVGAQSTRTAGGLDGLGGLLNQLGGGGLLDNVLGAQPTDVSRGNDVLGEIFGSKNVSREVANHAASQTGLDSSLLKQMLPMLAMVVAGVMAKHAQGNPSSSGGGLGACADRGRAYGQ